jgi:hypothetical protein
MGGKPLGGKALYWSGDDVLSRRSEMLTTCVSEGGATEGRARDGNRELGLRYSVMYILMMMTVAGPSHVLDTKS